MRKRPEVTSDGQLNSKRCSHVNIPAVVHPDGCCSKLMATSFQVVQLHSSVAVPWHWNLRLASHAVKPLFHRAHAGVCVCALFSFSFTFSLCTHMGKAVHMQMDANRSGSGANTDTSKPGRLEGPKCKPGGSRCGAVLLLMITLGLLLCLLLLCCCCSTTSLAVLSLLVIIQLFSLRSHRNWLPSC